MIGLSSCCVSVRASTDAELSGRMHLPAKLEEEFVSKWSEMNMHCQQTSNRRATCSMRSYLR